MRPLLLSILAGLLLLSGCGEKGEKVPDQLIGKWLEETPETKDASPEALAVGLTYEFKPGGTMIMSQGPMTEKKSYRMKDGKLVIEGMDPQTLDELSANRLVLGSGPGKMTFTRK